MELVNFGSLNLDHVYTVSQFVSPGETRSAQHYQIYCGGKGLNQSVAAARAGATVRHAGILGRGGEMLREMLEQNGVDVSLLRQSDAPQGHAIIQVNSQGENCILLFGGSNRAVTREDVDRVLATLHQPAYILLQNEISQLEYMVERAFALGFPVALNASPIDETLLRLDLSKLSWLMINEVEGEQLSGAQEPQEILQRLSARYPRLQILLTLGKDGAICFSGGAQIRQGIFPVPTVDTTAAGDTFTGYFLAEICRGSTYTQAMRVAAMASALAVSKQGAAPSIPSLQQVMEAFTEYSENN